MYTFYSFKNNEKFNKIAQEITEDGVMVKNMKSGEYLVFENRAEFTKLLVKTFQENGSCHFEEVQYSFGQRNEIKPWCDIDLSAPFPGKTMEETNGVIYEFITKKLLRDYCKWAQEQIESGNYEISPTGKILTEEEIYFNEDGEICQNNEQLIDPFYKEINPENYYVSILDSHKYSKTGKLVKISYHVIINCKISTINREKYVCSLLTDTYAQIPFWKMVQAEYFYGMEKNGIDLQVYHFNKNLRTVLSSKPEEPARPVNFITEVSQPSIPKQAELLGKIAGSADGVRNLVKTIGMDRLTQYVYNKLRLEKIASSPELLEDLYIRPNSNQIAVATLTIGRPKEIAVEPESVDVPEPENSSVITHKIMKYLKQYKHEELWESCTQKTWFALILAIKDCVGNQLAKEISNWYFSKFTKWNTFADFEQSAKIIDSKNYNRPGQGLKFIKKFVNKIPKPPLTKNMTIINEPEFPGKYYEEFISSQDFSLFVKSPCGTGKTKHLIQMLQKSGKTFLVLTYRRQLAASIAADFNLVNYMDVQANEFHGQFVCQLESLHKFHKYLHQYDIVIFDESENLINQLSSSTHRNFGRLMDSIEHIMANTKTIFMDALLGHKTVDFVKAYKIDPNIHAKFIKNNCQAFAGKTFTKIYKHKKLLQKIDQGIAAGEQVIVPTNSRKFANKVFAHVQNVFPGLPIIKYTSETDNQILDVNAEWAKYKCIIYSPAIEAGVSYYGNAGRVCAMFKNDINNHQGCFQALFRARKCSQYYLWTQAPAGQIMDKLTLEEALAKVNINDHMNLIKNESNIKFKTVENIMEIGFKQIIDESDICSRILAKNAIYNYKSSAKVGQYLWREIKAAGGICAADEYDAADGLDKSPAFSEQDNLRAQANYLDNIVGGQNANAIFTRNIITTHLKLPEITVDALSSTGIKDYKKFCKKLVLHKEIKNLDKNLHEYSKVSVESVKIAEFIDEVSSGATRDQITKFMQKHGNSWNLIFMAEKRKRFWYSDKFNWKKTVFYINKIIGLAGYKLHDYKRRTQYKCNIDAKFIKSIEIAGLCPETLCK